MPFRGQQKHHKHIHPYQLVYEYALSVNYRMVRRIIAMEPKLFGV